VISDKRFDVVSEVLVVYELSVSDYFDVPVGTDLFKCISRAD
jgi:hypothetical protein